MVKVDLHDNRYVEGFPGVHGSRDKLIFRSGTVGKTDKCVQTADV